MAALVRGNDRDLREHYFITSLGFGFANLAVGSLQRNFLDSKVDSVASIFFNYMLVYTFLNFAIKFFASIRKTEPYEVTRYVSLPLFILGISSFVTFDSFEPGGVAFFCAWQANYAIKPDVTFDQFKRDMIVAFAFSRLNQRYS